VTASGITAANGLHLQLTGARLAGVYDLPLVAGDFFIYGFLLEDQPSSHFATSGLPVFLALTFAARTAIALVT
jgi:hypothetical protein